MDLANAGNEVLMVGEERALDSWFCEKQVAGHKESDMVLHQESSCQGLWLAACELAFQVICCIVLEVSRMETVVGLDFVAVIDIEGWR